MHSQKDAHRDFGGEAEEGGRLVEDGLGAKERVREAEDLPRGASMEARG